MVGVAGVPGDGGDSRGTRDGGSSRGARDGGVSKACRVVALFQPFQSGKDFCLKCCQ